jgi:tight adherence protein B
MSALAVAVAVFLLVFLLFILASSIFGAEDRRRREQVSRRLEALNMAARRGDGDDNDRLDLLRHELLGSLPLMDRILHRIELFGRLRTFLIQSEVPWTIGDLLTRTGAAAAIGGAIGYWRTEIPTIAVVTAVCAGSLPILYVAYRRNKRFLVFESQLPGALDLICRALRAGHGLVAGLKMVGDEVPDPVGSEFRKTFDEQNFGLELKESLYNLTERVPLQDVRIIITAILIQRETGGNLAEVLEKAARVIRERYRLKRQIRTHTAQGRLTGWILSLLPLLLGIALFLVRPEFMSTLWTTDRGRRWLVMATIMMIIGAIIIRRIIRIRV